MLYLCFGPFMTKQHSVTWMYHIDLHSPTDGHLYCFGYYE